jgi:hypothetical protein
MKPKTRGKRPQKRSVTSAPNRNQPFLRNTQNSSPIIQDFKKKGQIKIINRRRFRAVGLLLGLGFGPGCLAQAGA